MGVNDWVGGSAPKSSGGGGMGMGFPLISQGIDYVIQRDNQQRADRQQEKLMDIAQRNQYAMWQKTGPVGQVDQMKKAGLNPGLMYGMGGGGSGTTGSPAAPAPASTSYRPGVDVSGMALMAAQIANINADTELKKTTAQKTGGVDTEKTKQDIEMSKLSQVIADYTGRNAKDVYELISKPNRELEGEANAFELMARKEVAETIWELNESGEMKKMNNEQIKAVIASRQKTEEEKKNVEKQFQILEENLKGAKFGNVINEIEAKVASSTGLSRDNIMKVIMLLLTKKIKAAE